MAIDEEAAELAWPTFFARFRDHPSLGLGSVDDYAVTPVIKEGTSSRSGPGDIEESHTPSTARCPNRSSNITSVDDSDDEDTHIEDDHEEDSGAVTKKLKSSAPVVGGVRTSKKKSAGSNAGQFLAAFAEIQAASQQRQIEHDQKM